MVRRSHTWRARLARQEFLRTTGCDRVNAYDRNADEEFERILKEYAGPFARLAAVYEQDLGLREDLLQEIALAVWRALPSFRGESSERTFLYRIAHNRALTHIGKRHRAFTDLDEAEDLPDACPNPEDVFRLAQLRTSLQQAIPELPLPLTQVWVLALEGVPNIQIAEILGITENNVRVRLARGLKHLRRIMRIKQ